MSELPCVSCGVVIAAESSNCPHCGQRQMTLATVVGYLTLGLPVVLGGVGVGAVVGAPSLVDATVGVGGLAGALGGVYGLSAVALLHSYAKRRRRIDRGGRSSERRPAERRPDADVTESSTTR